ncbi:hypothetical protein [Zavarzinella formosa]|uniref:hypothetical protein n=1 Tax=Zavarzinella formosa TaxID=360055 RepID=UPI00030DA87E|nr:hypothetical protein [Zavarzinella formosa]
MTLPFHDPCNHYSRVRETKTNPNTRTHGPIIMAKLYRCYNCSDDKGMPGRDFAADKPVCPKCGLDGSPGSRFASKIVALRTIHLDPPHPTVKSAGTGQPACGVPRLGSMAMTGDPNVVNCPKCRETPEWKTLKARRDASPDDIELPDFPVVVDIEKQQFTKAAA